MSEDVKQESQKTVVAFIAGLLIGGLLVWVFGGTPETKEANQQDGGTDTSVVDGSADTSEAIVPDTTKVTDINVGDGSLVVSDQAAGNIVTIDSATFPTKEGWVAVRSYPNGQLGSILGAARFSAEQGLAPETVALLAATTPGRTYAVVFFTDDGDREFNLAGDAQIDGPIATFTAK